MTGARDDDELFVEYRRTGSRVLRNQIVDRQEHLAERCARRFQGRGESLDDLRQVAFIGLIRAVERFDPGRGVPFGAFAVPTIVGEIRRHFRDRGWAVSVPRRLKDARTPVFAAIDDLHQELGRSPRPAEVASRLGVDPDVVLETILAGNAYRPDPIEPGHDGGSPDAEGLMVDRLRAIEAIGRLGERDRLILYWRYFEERTQREIGARLGVGQVQVSRLLRAAIGELRGLLERPAG